MKFKSIPIVILALAATSKIHAATNSSGNYSVTPTATEPGNLAVAGTATVNGTFKVQPAPTPVVVTANANNAGQTSAVFGTDDKTSTAVRTTVGGVIAAYTNSTGGGAEIKNNGDTKLMASSGYSYEVTTSQVTEVRIYNANQGTLAGQPVPNTQSYYLVNSKGVEIVGSRVSVTPSDTKLATATLAQAAFAELIDGDGVGDINFTSTDFAPALVATPLAGTGGNLTVEGDLSVGAIADVEKELVGLKDKDVALQGNINAEAATRTSADTAIRSEFAAADTVLRNKDVDLQGNINAEAATRTSADTAIRSEFSNADTAIRSEFSSADTAIRSEFGSADTAIRSEFAAADTVLRDRDVALQGSIDAEVATRTSADTAIRSEFSGADTAIRSEFAAADTVLRNELQVADSKLQSQIDSNRNQIDSNTRGIAMVAAMTNTTIAAGMTQAIDFNIAQFDNATGFAFGYGYRVNENLQVNAAGASTTDFEEGVARMGVSYQW